MPRKRARTVGAKVDEAEYALVTAAAGERSVGGWARDVLLAAASVARPSAEQLLLSEFLGLRSIVLGVQFALVNGELLTNENMQRLMARADQEKLARAAERLAAVSIRRQP